METWHFPVALILAFLCGLALGSLLLWLWYRARITLLLAERQTEAERTAWSESAQEQLRLHFQVLTGQLLEQSSQELASRSREQLEAVAAPLSRTLEQLGGQVRELEKERQGAYQGLRQEIQLLRTAHADLHRAAGDLDRALRSSSARGRWGEVQLRRVVEMAGMAEHVDFTEQPTAEGMRPDMIVHLPGRGVLPIDAKAPMKAYLDASSAAGEEERRRCLDAHLKALRQRTAELGQRRYWEQFDSTPDFVVMFLPNEACLGAAFERDPDFLDFALRHRVMPVTPVTLLALLKSVAYGWQQHRVAENARQIAQLGRDLHGRLITFLERLRGLGRGLDAAVESYNQALGSLERRVLPAARRLEETGASTDPLPAVEPVRQSVRRPMAEPDDGG